MPSENGIEKYPVCRPRRKDVMPAGGGHYKATFDVFLAFDFAEIRRRGKRGIFRIFQ
jgi:hypothetical protein